MTRRGTALAAVAVAALGTGCTSLARGTFRAASASPYALPAVEQRMRDAFAGARWEAALTAASSERRGGPADALLRDLYAGTAAYYAGRWDSSAAYLERAASAADDRYTKSVSRGALSLATNDLALPYLPGHNERLLVHYYALLAWLRRGSLPDAVVEARRLSAMLQAYDANGTPLDASTRTTLRYLTAVVFDAAGERNDAAVAFRNAGLPALADRPAAPGDSGEVLVVVEQGFVAHRVEQRLAVRTRDDDWAMLLGAGHGVAREGTVSRVASMLTGDEGLWADAASGELRLGGSDSLPNDATTGESEWDDSTRRTLRRHETGWSTRARIAWPAYRRTPPPSRLALVVDTTPLGGAMRADVSSAEAGDFRRDRAARLTRLLVRAALREAAASSLEKKHTELASLARGMGGALERADTRSWHLLPGAITVARLRLPVGEHQVVADVDGARVPVGVVHVAARGLALATTRLWGPPPTAVAETARATAP